MALIEPKLLTVAADQADVTKADAKRVLAAHEEIVLEELGNGQ